MKTVVRPKKQSSTNHELNPLLRRETLSEKEQFVWAVYNSGDPVWVNDPFTLEIVLFASKSMALDFVRSLLKKYWDVDASKDDDSEVENLMFNEDIERYLHLFELKVHSCDADYTAAVALVAS